MCYGMTHGKQFKNKIRSIFEKEDPPFNSQEHAQIWNAIKELAERVAKLEGSFSVLKWGIALGLPLIVSLLLYLIGK